MLEWFSFGYLAYPENPSGSRAFCSLLPPKRNRKTAAVPFGLKIYPAIPPLRCGQDKFSKRPHCDAADPRRNKVPSAEILQEWQNFLTPMGLEMKGERGLLKKAWRKLFTPPRRGGHNGKRSAKKEHFRPLCKKQSLNLPVLYLPSQQAVLQNSKP